MKNASNGVAHEGGTQKALLGAEKKPSRWRTTSDWISMFDPRSLLYYGYQMSFFTI